MRFITSTPNTILRLAAASVLLSAGISVGAQVPAKAKTITEASAGMQRIDGFLPMYWDASSAKLWLEIARWNEDFLYIPSLSAGLGSNDVGLDRGKLGDPRLVQFMRAGSRVLLVQQNPQFRALSSNEMERRAVRDSFAVSALWGFDIAAEEAGHVLVDATAFFQHDFAGVGDALTEAKQGGYHVDAARCAFYLPQTKGFPQNSEVEVMLTFAGDGSGKFVQDVTPAPDSITLREHHSFIRLPQAHSDKERGYEPRDYIPRDYDPRAGYFALSYRDYSAPLGQDIDKRVILRHRLQKANPAAASSAPLKPIVYYVDGGAPDDVRRALMEGASWWGQAFEAAGFQNAFQVKLLPPDVDPMDIRYNVVQWVHRYTRGWSYGAAIADPRTGEILKGQVTLGSLRYRQDYLIFSSLLAPFTAAANGTPALDAAVYARLRQLAAHEIGHTLGLAHNFAASARNRESVMDYPHPLVTLKGAIPDLSNAYANGIGDWDKIAIRYGYSQFAPNTDEKVELGKIMQDAIRAGHLFITDADSRPLGGAHPKAHLWDNGSDPVDELAHILKIRAAALARFGENNIRVGEPMSQLDETLAPLYLLHRYQTEAAGKVLGGLDYSYALRGDGQVVTHIVPAAQQKRALAVLLQTVQPGTLTLPARIIELIPPHPPAYLRSRESFPAQTGLTFDPVAAAEAAASVTGSLLFNRERAARLIEYHARAAENPGLRDVLRTVAQSTWQAPSPPGLAGRVKEAVDVVLFRQLLSLAADEGAAPLVRAEAAAWLDTVKATLPARLSRLQKEWENHPEHFKQATPVEPPPGQPIGEDDGCVRIVCAQCSG